MSVLLHGWAAQATSEFEVPSHCGTRVQFETSIRARVGDTVAGSILGALTLSIREEPDTYTLTMQVGQVTRFLQDRDCAELLRAAVVVAIALWEAPAPPVSANPLQPPGASAAPEALNAARSADSQSVPPAAHVSHPWGQIRLGQTQGPLQLGVELGVVAGLQPKPGPFVGVRATFERQRWGVTSSVRWAPARSDRDANDHGVQVAAGGARVAVFFKPVRFIGLELGARVDYLRGTGLGSDQSDSAELWRIGPVLGFWLTPLCSGRASLSVGAEGQLSLGRRSFEIEGYGPVFRVPAVGGSTYLLAGYRF